MSSIETHTKTSDAEWKLIEACSLLAQFDVYGLIWLHQDLTVEDTFGPLVGFLAPGQLVTDQILPLIGLEQDILALREDTRKVIELPAVAVITTEQKPRKLNFTLFWNAARNCPMALAYRSAAQSELEVELSRQIRARLMAEAAVIAKSKELARANADLESFAAIVSHDLKAPLRHLRQMTETAFDRAGMDQSPILRDTLRAIEMQSRRMADMLTALLDYSTLGRKCEGLEPVDTAELISAVRVSLPKTDHSVAIEGAWPTLSTLRAPLDLVLRNLVGNALQHHDRRAGTITVRATEQPQAVVFTISDDGPGIEPCYHETVFLPFRTLQRDNGGGSAGMGLTAVKKTVETVGGSIEVLSDPSAARGTTFNVYWPKTIRD